MRWILPSEHDLKGGVVFHFLQNRLPLADHARLPAQPTAKYGNQHEQGSQVKAEPATGKFVGHGFILSAEQISPRGIDCTLERVDKKAYADRDSAQGKVRSDRSQVCLFQRYHKY